MRTPRRALTGSVTPRGDTWPTPGLRIDLASHTQNIVARGGLLAPTHSVAVFRMQGSLSASAQPLRTPAQSLRGQKEQARQHDQQRAGRGNSDADLLVDAGTHLARQRALARASEQQRKRQPEEPVGEPIPATGVRLSTDARLYSAHGIPIVLDNRVALP
jgi:hypothetical protein